MNRIIITEIQKRFADIDVFGHVNNIHQQEFLDIGKTDYYEQVIGFDVFTARITLMIVAGKTDFLEQVRFADRTCVKTSVKKLGTKSVTLHQRIVNIAADGTEILCTEAEAVLVCYDRQAGQTVEIPREWRERIGGNAAAAL